ncbi:MAG TPA: hypothetical protein VM680_15035 [Verrucomicrobiae bacterium]|nr:hypothetical protein [Verrucomicrobiae bacterium]
MGPNVNDCATSGPILNAIPAATDPNMTIVQIKPRQNGIGSFFCM